VILSKVCSHTPAKLPAPPLTGLGAGNGTVPGNYNEPCHCAALHKVHAGLGGLDLNPLRERLKPAESASSGRLVGDEDRPVRVRDSCRSNATSSPPRRVAGVRLSLSECRRFVVADALHVDREVFETLAAWAAEHHLSMQDAIQLALCAFNDNAQSARLVFAGPSAGLSREPGDSKLLDKIE